MFDITDISNCLTEDDFKSKAKTICCQFLTTTDCSWGVRGGGRRFLSLVDSIQCSRIKTGQSNRLFVCELLVNNNNVNNNDWNDHQLQQQNVTDNCSSSASTAIAIPVPVNKIIVRFYGSEFTGRGNQYKSISDELECQILQYLATKGMAPKVHATFEGGRIDEYLDQASIGAIETLRSPPFLRTLGRKIATFHAIQLDLPKPNDPYEIIRSMESQSHSILTSLDTTTLDPVQVKLLTTVRNFLSTKKSSEIVTSMANLRQRLVFAHMDLNPTNFLLLPNRNCNNSNNNNSNSRQTRNESMDIMLIDIENCQTGYRGMDLGKFFIELSLTEDNCNSTTTSTATINNSNNNMMNRINGGSPSPTGSSKVSGLQPISDGRMIVFIKSYLAEWSLISDDYTPALDNEDNLFTEIKFGLMFALMAHIIWNVLHPNFPSTKLLLDTVKRISLYQHFERRWFSHDHFRPRLLSL